MPGLISSAFLIVAILLFLGVFIVPIWIIVWSLNTYNKTGVFPWKKIILKMLLFIGAIILLVVVAVVSSLLISSNFGTSSIGGDSTLQLKDLTPEEIRK